MKKYFSNYDANNFDFSLLGGKLELKNMFLNKDSINEILEKGNIPFQVKFGMVTKINIKVSLVGLYIELIEIEDLILVVSPDPSKGQKSEQKVFEGEIRNEILMHMLGNLENLKIGREMNPLERVNGIPQEILKTIKTKEEKDRIPFAEKGPLKVVKDTKNNTVEESKPNFMGPELMGIITGRLEFDISFKNIRFYFEDGQTLVSKIGSPQIFSFCLNLSDFKITTQDIRRFIDASGNFKDLFNINNVMSTLAVSTQLIYISLVLQRLTVEVYLGVNEILPPTLETDIRTKVPAYFVDYFQKLNSSRKGNNLELMIIDEFTTDIILGHDKSDVSSVPIQCLILYINLKELITNVQLNTLSQITSILNHVSSVSALTKVASMRPPLRVLDKQSVENIKRTYRLTSDQERMLQFIKRELFREHFAIAIWRDLYIQYNALDNIDMLRRMIFRYKMSSTLYQILMGATGNELKEDYKKFVAAEQEYLEKAEELKKTAQLQDPTAAPTASANETMRMRISRICTRLSKSTWKFHLHVRFHANIYANYYNDKFQKDASFILRGFDINLVKPRGRFHANIGIMLKNLLVLLNTQVNKKPAVRSIYDSTPQFQSSGADNRDRDSVGRNLNMGSE